MMNLLVKTTCFVFAVLSAVAAARSIRYESSELISDGVDNQYSSTEKNWSSFLIFKGTEDYTEKCEPMYGFLPCSVNLLGHLFLILVYEYLLFHGESYIASGGEKIFKILGPGVFGASAFQILGALPDSLILLASGLLNNKEKAQEYALTGVGLLAGTTIFLLTVVWGTCVIIGSTHIHPSQNSTSSRDKIQKLVSDFNGFGVTTDAETSYTARIMVFSVIPFLIILIPNLFQISSFLEDITIIGALMVSIVFLLLYFFYQIFTPWIQKRRLEYVKHEHLVVDIVTYLQEHAMERLFTEDGAPNVPALRRVFVEIDQDGDNFISLSELKELLNEVQLSNSNLDRNKMLSQVMRDIDLDGDNNITMDEFVTVITKWLHELKRTMDKRYHSVKSLKDLYKILQPWIVNKRKEKEVKQLVSEIISSVQSSALGNLYTESGAPDISAIKRLFEHIDRDKNNYISQDELKEGIISINFSKQQWDSNEIVKKIMERLDVNRDEMINEEEFVYGILKVLNNDQSPNSTELDHNDDEDDDTYQKTWEEIDTLVEEEEKSIEKSMWAWTKAIFRLVLGLVMLALLAEPLIESVHKLSTAADIPSFFVSFILVPLATNARGAISAIKAARKKKKRTTSLTFSEIYGGVFMNNLLGFSVLLCLIYFVGLSWRFSAEVFIVLIVSLIMGIAASFSSKFPVWTSFLAYMLYPLSLILVYVLHL